MNRFKLTALCVSGGILSSFAWSEWFPGYILLFSFVPFLLAENISYVNRQFQKPLDYFFITLPGFIVFNLLTLEWVRAANLLATVIIILWLSTIMNLVLYIAHLIRLRAGTTIYVIAFPLIWLAFEYMSLHSVYLSPWMMLGNGLAKEISFIQWYEFTGSGGGTLWILLSNIILSQLIAGFKGIQKRTVISLSVWLILIIIPATISRILYHSIRENDALVTEVIAIQPNIDPFTEKYSVSFEEQLSTVLNLAGQEIKPSTEWIIAPETVVDDPVDEAGVNENKYFKQVNDFAKNHFPVNIVIGMVSKKESTYHNSAFRIDSSGFPEIYHKSKLVAGIEQEFSQAFGRLINEIAPQLGETGWGYIPQKERAVFTHSVTGQKAGPVICYESVFGEFTAGFVRKGAQMLFIITNDGWWKNTNGYKQHLNYASLRAIETRRPIVRSANTGISCIIDIKGRRISETDWWTEGFIKARIAAEERLTFYVKHGDYILRLSSAAACLLLIITFIVLPLKKNTK